MNTCAEGACCFTGHRPGKLIGGEAALRAALRREIVSAIACGTDRFITGMAPGIDIWAAEEVLNIRKGNKNIGLICAVPFEGAEKNRPAEQQSEFRMVLAEADEVVYVCPHYSARSFHLRDEWMVDHAAKVIAVFNGAHGGTEYTLRYAKKRGREIILINDVRSEPV